MIICCGGSKISSMIKAARPVKTLSWSITQHDARKFSVSFDSVSLSHEIMEITASAVSLETIYGYHVRRRRDRQLGVKVIYRSEKNGIFNKDGM